MLVAALICCSQINSAYSQARTETRHEVVFALGLADIFDNEKYTGYGLEYRFSPIWRELRPVVGFSSTIEHDDYFYVGGRYFISLSENWQFKPSFGIGLFEKGEDLDLGGSVEFRTGLAFTYNISERIDIGAELAHLSNSRIYKSNPGTETLSLSIAIKL